MFLLITHDHAMRPVFAIHATGNLNEIDRRRKVALIGIPERFRDLRIDELRMVLKADIEKAVAAGIAEGKLAPDTAPRPGD